MKSGNPIPLPRIVSEAEWQAARAELLASIDFGRTTPKGETFGLSVFSRDGDDVYRTYFTEQRGVEALGNVWSLLDLTPYGRQEEWEDSPPGWPQTPPYTWWRRHDEY